MKITSFEKSEHRGHEIYVRNFGKNFEFLFVHKGKIHTAFQPLTPDFKNRVLYLLRRQDLPYSKEQLDAARSIMIYMAQQVIDELVSKK